MHPWCILLHPAVKAATLTKGQEPALSLGTKADTTTAATDHTTPVGMAAAGSAAPVADSLEVELLCYAFTWVKLRDSM